MPSYDPVFKQHFLKTTSRTTGARIVAAELLNQFFVTVDDPETAFDVRFRRKPLAALTAALERRIGWCSFDCAWYTSLVGP